MTKSNLSISILILNITLLNSLHAAPATLPTLSATYLDNKHLISYRFTPSQTAELARLKDTDQNVSMIDNTGKILAAHPQPNAINQILTPTSSSTTYIELAEIDQNTGTITPLSQPLYLSSIGHNTFCTDVPQTATKTAPYIINAITLRTNSTVQDPSSKDDILLNNGNQQLPISIGFPQSTSGSAPVPYYPSLTRCYQSVVLQDNSGQDIPINGSPNQNGISLSSIYNNYQLGYPGYQPPALDTTPVLPPLPGGNTVYLSFMNTVEGATEQTIQAQLTYTESGATQPVTVTTQNSQKSLTVEAKSPPSTSNIKLITMPYGTGPSANMAGLNITNGSDLTGIDYNYGYFQLQYNVPGDPGPINVNFASISSIKPLPNKGESSYTNPSLINLGKQLPNLPNHWTIDIHSGPWNYESLYLDQTSTSGQLPFLELFQCPWPTQADPTYPNGQVKDVSVYLSLSAIDAYGTLVTIPSTSLTTTSAYPATSSRSASGPECPR